MTPPNVLRVNEVEEREAYRSAVSQILREVQNDHAVTLLEIAETINVSIGTISNASNKKCSLDPIYLKRIGSAYGCHHLDPYARLVGGRVVAIDPDGGEDVLPIISLAAHRIAMARSPGSPGGVSETLGEQLGYLPDLRKMQRDIAALIVRIERRAAA